MLEDGTAWNRWGNEEQDGPDDGYEDRYLATQAYIAGEEPNGRWF